MSELLWPPYVLRRSEASEADPNVLYSGNVAEQLGKKQGSLGVYVHPCCVPWPWVGTVTSRFLSVLRRRAMPQSIEMMLWDSAPTEQGWDVVEELCLRSAHDASHRYDALGDDRAVRSIYMPKGTFRGAPPTACFVGLRPARVQTGAVQS